MADDKREKRGLRARWHDRRREPTGEESERLVREAEERARLKQARDIANDELRGAGRREHRP